MRNVASSPPKSSRATCDRCGITAPSPIVVPRDSTSDRGACSNRKACELRRLRAAIKAKAAKS